MYTRALHESPDAHMLGSHIDRVARGQLTRMSTLLSSVSRAWQRPVTVRYCTAAASRVGIITRTTPERVCRTTTTQNKKDVKIQVSIHRRSCWDTIMDLSRSQVT